ncbi:MAG TPA: hypothetical protein VFJ16_05660 [Longimicrobium sp.]|nr:hypothetical protein [Longimicrobium sp.]
MPAVPFDQMPDDARVWVFAAPRPLAPADAQALLERVDGFLERWAAHGAPVVGARDFRHDQFLLIAADERATGVSGCSIDSLFHALAEVERELGTDLRRTSSFVFYRDSTGDVQGAERPIFRHLAAAGQVSESTPVFDNTIGTVGDLRSGGWEKRFGESWHARAFPIGAATAG